MDGPEHLVQRGTRSKFCPKNAEKPAGRNYRTIVLLWFTRIMDCTLHKVSHDIEQGMVLVFFRDGEDEGMT